MKGAAISDLHLGFRGAGRTVAGRNQREMDVERAWFAAVDLICEAQPDLITVAGDVFHTVRPNFHAVKAWQDGIRKLNEETQAHIVVIGGNHETPKTAETLTPNIVAADLADIITGPCRRGYLAHSTNEWVAIHCLPFVAVGQEGIYALEPDAEADLNIMVIHAAVRSSARPGALPAMYGGAAAYDVSRAEGFDVVCCGDYHEFTVLSAPQDGRMGAYDWREIRDPEDPRWHASPLAFYSGSIERTSSNVWQEDAPKGVVLYDTAARTMEFREVPTRPVRDYVLNATFFDPRGPYSAADVNDTLASILTAPESADALVRLRVNDFPRGERDAIDWAAVAALKERCVHFHLDLRYAEWDIRDLGDRRERAARTLADDAQDFFAEDEPAVLEAAFSYLGLETPALTLT